MYTTDKVARCLYRETIDSPTQSGLADNHLLLFKIKTISDVILSEDVKFLHSLLYVFIFCIFPLCSWGSWSEAEDEEVFEEIRRLRLERGHLLQKIKALEQQQNNTTTVLEEVI